MPWGMSLVVQAATITQGWVCTAAASCEGLSVSVVSNPAEVEAGASSVRRRFRYPAAIRFFRAQMVFASANDWKHV